MKDGSKICKYCKTEIPAGAKICPNCMKKQGGKVWPIVLVVIVVLIVLFAVVGNNNDSPTTADDGNNNNINSQEVEKKEFTQDEVVNFEDVAYTVTKVEKVKGGNYDEAKSGYEYVIVHIKIQNNSDEKISYNPFDWKMENSQGQEVDGAFTIVDSDTALESGDLNPGGVVEGTLAFEQPEGDTGLKLNYYGNMFDEEASFKIALN